MHHALLIATIAVLAQSFWMRGHATAATIERYSDPVMGCTMLLSGEIVGGDVERLQQLVATIDHGNPGQMPGRLCLNSPGGSYLEGVRLAQRIREYPYLGTAIGEGHVCESACAVAFMSGGWTEGGYDSVRPIMHPQSQLGFHAPSIEISSGQYSEEQVAQAWNVALQAVAEIVAMRSRPLNVSDNYNFNEQLFLQMLLTPPESMFYVDTVEKATRFDIAVYPVGVNSVQPYEALINLCVFASGWVTDGPNFVPEIRRTGDNEIEVFFPEGFGEEAMGSCRAVLSLEGLHDRGVYLHSRQRPISIESGTGAYPYMTFNGSTSLDRLPTDIDSTWQEFITRVQVRAAPEVQTFGSCWLASPIAQITNVNEYVNLRGQSDFSAPVIRQVPLGEDVRLLRAENITVIGQERDRQSCINACQAFGSNVEDSAARDRAQQCIQDNMLWYEITDARGNRGWVSRRFLEEVR